MWGSWPASVGFGPPHISPVVDVEEKDAAGSWLFFFPFLLSPELYTSVLTFPSHKLFFKTCLSARLVLLSTNTPRLLHPSSAQLSGLR